MQTYQFKFTCALTWVHTALTLLGMQLFLAMGMFKRKQLPTMKVAPIAAAFVAYIVLGNLSLNVNPVSFYQVRCAATACKAMGAQTRGKRQIGGGAATSWRVALWGTVGPLHLRGRR
jgi:solute carrier family 35 protein E3